MARVYAGSMLDARESCGVRRRAAQNLALATALSLLGFKPAEESPRVRNRAELARACRALEALCVHEGTRYPARRIAVDCALALEAFAAHFRSAATQLQSNRRKPHES